jgi:hypothetical protein
MEISKYDPKKTYRWEPNAEFSLTGIEFDRLYQIIKVKYYQGEVPPVAVAEMYNILHEKFIDSVNKGVSKELQQEVEKQEIENPLI